MVLSTSGQRSPRSRSLVPVPRAAPLRSVVSVNRDDVEGVAGMTRIRTIAATITLGAAAAFFVAGPYMVYRGVDARSQVAAALKAENITTPEDASRPDVRVQDGPTAVVQDEVI